MIFNHPWTSFVSLTILGRSVACRELSEMMLRKIISGHQTGADIAAIDAAMANGFPRGGWVPKGRKTEIGPLPDLYIVQEMSTGAYPKRTEKNVLISDGTVIFSHGQLTGGSDLTRKLAVKHGNLGCISTSPHRDAAAVALLSDFIAENAVAVLNVAGPKSSGDPKIYDAVLFMGS